KSKRPTIAYAAATATSNRDPDQRQSQADLDNRLRSGAKTRREGRAKRQCVVCVRSQLCWRVSADEHPARKSRSIIDDRMSAVAVPVCARDHIKRHFKWRISALDVASDRFRRTLPEAAGRNEDCATGNSSRLMGN